VFVVDIPFIPGTGVQPGAANTSGMFQPIGVDADEKVRVMALAAPQQCACRNSVVDRAPTALGRVTCPERGAKVPAGTVMSTVSGATVARLLEGGVAPRVATDVHALQAADGVIKATSPAIRLGWGTAQEWTLNVLPGMDMWAPHAFCCALKETLTARLHELSITGTPKTDRIRLRQCTSEFLSPISPPLSVTIIGASGDDLLFGSDDISTAYQEELRGGIGSDRIYGGSGDDTLIGNEGDDFLFGGAGNDFLFGNGNNDELHGGAGIDNLQGGNNDDTLQGDAGFDDLRGGSGADLLCDAFDADDLRGQDGNDRLFYLPAMPGPTLAIPDPPGVGTYTCSNMPGFPNTWPTCEVQVLFTDSAFNACPEWSP
jgi:hypothetical protein